MFRHPKYYKELRKRNKLDQAISLRAHDGERERATGPGPKPRYTPTGILLGVDLGDKPQASSAKLTKSQASSGKHQAPSTKAQA
jgi:hypothetical protein